MSSTGRSPADVREHHLEVVRTARFYTAGPLDRAVEELWFVLHGYRQLAARFLARFQALDDGTRLIVAPEALSRFYVDLSSGRHGPEARVGAAWMTREDREHEIVDYVRYLDGVEGKVRSLLSAPPERTVLLGFSQGCHTAARWAVLGDVRPQRLILWGDHVPPDLPEGPARERLARMRVTVVHGSEDASVSGLDPAARRDRLSALGLPWEHLLYRGGHDVHSGTLLELARGAPGPHGEPAAQNSPTNPISGTSS